MAEQPQLQTLSKKELVALCKERQLRGFSGKTKEELLQLLEQPPPTTQDTSTFLFQISDSFVHPLLKLSNGKNGHGEGRIYTGDSNERNIHMCSKPITIRYSDTYKTDIESFLDDPSNFSKVEPKRKEMVFATIDQCSEKQLFAREQNGKQDVCRYYIGAKQDTANKKLWSLFRQTLIPKEYCLVFTEEEDQFLCSVTKVSEVGTLNSLKSVSNVQKEYFKYLQTKLDIEIQGGHNNTSEFQLRNPENGYYWPVDGAHICGQHRCATATTPCPWNNTVWEFQGDWIHGNPDLYDETAGCFNRTYKEKREKDQKKKEFYESQGFKVIIMWESEWTKEKKELKRNNQTWL